ncbi:hypothetical protein ACRE_048480 [Hapsidospora chrysogenum ATCC 11550]|uniref:Diacylglycerol O-acyltransferase n=1 Tax=Hapsidospora chrysogenum (strain ATCC 11550 / CBS 779.69 / DSM 880 / IAM 14645 / JCM 23072 / IMI 49137) TaxID=857340 RepID=A0A086T4T6_HAPC1|nr:hypothetical protein ACRE_048480 [Hapsidospora chrysogenum ATCC 11550]
MADANDKKAAATASRPKVIRPFGHLRSERYLEGMYYNEQYCGTAVTCRYIIPAGLADASKHQEVQKRLVRAVAQTVLDHPQTQVALTGVKTKRPSYIKLDSINLDDLIDWCSVTAEDDYPAFADARLTQELDRPFTHLDTRPGWRITALRPEGSAFIDVVFNFRHTTTDGTGAKIFQESLLKHLNDPDADSSSLNLQGGSTLLFPADHVTCKHPPPMDKWAEFSVGLCFALSTSWRELKPSFLQKKPTALQRSWGPVKPGPGKTERRTIRIGATNAKKIVGACREHKTTVTGLLHGILAATLMWETRSFGRGRSLKATTAIDMRRFLGRRPSGLPGTELDPHKTIGVFVTALFHEFDEPTVEQLCTKMRGPIEGKGMAHMEGIVWEVAETTRGAIRAKIDRGLKNDIVALVKVVGDWRAERARLVKKPRVEAWMVTNLGVMDVNPPTEKTKDDETSGWRAGRAFFSLSAETPKPVFSLSSITAKDGDMCVDVTWQADSNEFVDGIGNRLGPHLYAWLNYIATSEWREDVLPPAFGADLA